MQISKEVAKQQVSIKVEAGAEAAASSEKQKETGSSFEVRDTVEISREGYVMQQATQSKGKVLSLPKGAQPEKAAYQDNNSSSLSQKPSAKDAKGNAALELKQTAASIMDGKSVSPAAEKALKNSNPTLYAQAKAKAKAKAKAQAQAKAKGQEKAKAEKAKVEKA